MQDNAKDKTSPVALPQDILDLSASFPILWPTNSTPGLTMRQRIRDMLPQRARAQYLCEQARRNAFWQYVLQILC